MDFVITVCDNAAGEVCPVWPGQPMTAHWGVADPAAVEGTDEAKRRAFAQAGHILRNRIQLFASLPLASSTSSRYRVTSPPSVAQVSEGEAICGGVHGNRIVLAVVVGSGIMGERLAEGNVTLALLANSLATGSGCSS